MDLQLLINVGDTVPAFSVQTTDGELFTIGPGAEKPFLVNFFIIHCRFCRDSLEFFKKHLWGSFSQDQFGMICIGRDHTTKELEEFKERKSYLFPMAADPERKIFNLFASLKVPRNFLISRAGVVVYQSRGFDSDEYLKLAGKVKSMT